MGRRRAAGKPVVLRVLPDAIRVSARPRSWFRFTGLQLCWSAMILGVCECGISITCFFCLSIENSTKMQFFGVLVVVILVSRTDAKKARISHEPKPITAGSRTYEHNSDTTVSTYHTYISIFFNLFFGSFFHHFEHYAYSVNLLFVSMYQDQSAAVDALTSLVSLSFLDVSFLLSSFLSSSIHSQSSPCFEVVSFFPSPFLKKKNLTVPPCRACPTTAPKESPRNNSHCMNRVQYMLYATIDV